MNLQEYAEAIKKIHSAKALMVWAFYKGKSKPVSKHNILSNLPSIKDEEALDELISYLDERGFKVMLK